MIIGILIRSFLICSQLDRCRAVISSSSYVVVFCTISSLIFFSGAASGCLLFLCLLLASVDDVELATIISNR